MRLALFPFITVLHGLFGISAAEPGPNPLLIPAFRPVLRNAPAEVFPRLSRRQFNNGCVNIGYSPCPDRTACCPTGYSCIGSGALTQCSLFGGVCPPGTVSCADGSTTNSGCCASGTACGAIPGTCVRRDTSNTVTLTPTASVVIVTARPASSETSTPEKSGEDKKDGNSVPIGPIIGGIGGAALLIAGAVLGTRYYLKRKKQKALEEPVPVIPAVGGGKPEDHTPGNYYAPPAYPQPVAEVKPAFDTNMIPVVPQPANINMSPPGQQQQQQQQMGQNQMSWDQSRMSGGGTAYQQSSYNNNNPGGPIYRQELDGISMAAPGYTSTPTSPVPGMHPYPQDYRELDGTSSPPPGGYPSQGSPIQRAVSPASNPPTQYGNQWGQGNPSFNNHPPQN